MNHRCCCRCCAATGHETTAATLAWTLYYISTHPEVEAKALAEIASVLGDRCEPRADDVPKLVSGWLLCWSLCHIVLWLAQSGQLCSWLRRVTWLWLWTWWCCQCTTRCGEPGALA
jgi:hypothetical protein